MARWLESKTNSSLIVQLEEIAYWVARPFVKVRSRTERVSQEVWGM